MCSGDLSCVVLLWLQCVILHSQIIIIIIMSIADSESQWFSCNWSSGGNHFYCFTNNGSSHHNRHTWQVIVVTEGHGSLNNVFFFEIVKCRSVEDWRM